MSLNLNTENNKNKTESIFFSLYSRIYDKYAITNPHIPQVFEPLYPYDLTIDIEKILMKEVKSNIFEKEILELVDHIVNSKFKVTCNGVQVNTNGYFLNTGTYSITFYEIILRKICRYKLNPDAINSIIIYVDNMLSYFKQKKAIKNIKTFRANKGWITEIVSNGHVFTKEEMTIVKKFGYIMPMSSMSVTKFTPQYFSKLIQTEKGLEDFVTNTEKYLEIMEKNKIVFTSKTFVEFVCQYEIYFLRNIKSLENKSLSEMINVIIKCGYVLTISSIMFICLKFNDLFFEKIYDIISEISDKFKINKLEVFTKLFMVDPDCFPYLVKNNCSDLIPKENVIPMLITFNSDVELLMYYTDKKYIGSTNDLILSLYTQNYRFIDGTENMVTHFLKTGATINSDVYEYICMLGLEEKYKHLFVGNETKRLEISKKIKPIYNLHKNDTLHKTNIYPINVTTTIQNSDDILIKVCQQNHLYDIIMYFTMYDVQITQDIIDALFLNNDICVIMYTINYYNVKPTLQNIILHTNAFIRYTLGKIYYPELFSFKISSSITKINTKTSTDDVINETNQNANKLIDSNYDEIDEVPKKTKKSKSIKIN